MPKVAPAPADEAEARARLLPQSHGDVAAFARTASRWLERADLEGTKIGAAHAHLVKAEHAELVKATVLERRAPEPESLVGSLELHETRALVRQGEVETDEAFSGAGLFGGRRPFAIFLWFLFGTIMLVLSIQRVCYLAARDAEVEPARFFDVGAVARDAPAFAVPPAVDRCLGPCTHRDARRACEILGGTLPWGPSTASLSYDQFRDEERFHDADTWLGPRRRAPAGAFQWLDGALVADGPWASGAAPPTMAEDDCLYVVSGTDGRWAAAACGEKKIARCQGNATRTTRMELSIFLMVFCMAATLLWRAWALWRGRDYLAYHALTSFTVVFALTFQFFGITVYAHRPWAGGVFTLCLVTSGALIALQVGYHLALRNVYVAQLWITILFYYFGIGFVLLIAVFSWAWPIGPLLLVVAAYLHYSRNQALKTSWDMIKGDYEKYEATWARLVAETDDIDAHVARLQDELAAALGGGSTGVAAAIGRSVRRGRTGDHPRQCVGDLAVLFGQACKLNAYYQLAVATWSAGLTGAVVSHAPIKRRDRAIEKLWRSYRGDARFCIDLVRASITFQSFDAITECVKRIREDPRACVVHAKNRFRREYDAKGTAGYRNVSLSIVLVDAVTSSLGVETHVCELQLGIAPFEDLKHSMGGDVEAGGGGESGHQRYKRFRNLRAI